jgi:SSS family solute:Na+ symporter
MTELLMIALSVLFAYALYIASQCTRADPSAENYLHSGASLPTWTYVFAASGIIVAGLDLPAHLRLLSYYGFQRNQLVLGLIIVALTGALFQRRLTIAAQIVDAKTVGALLGAYHQSTSIRLYLLLVAFLFAVPFSGLSLLEAGTLLSASTKGTLPVAPSIAIIATFLFLFSAIGGWRAVVYVTAALSALLLVLMIFVSSFTESAFDQLAVLMRSGAAPPGGVMTDAIPGVIQLVRGIGKEMPNGGLWTTAAAASFAVAAIGLVLSPGFNFLGLTTRTRLGFAFSQVWVTAALTTGALLLLGPLIGAEMAASALQPAMSPVDTSFAPLLARLANVDQLAAVCLVVMLLASLLIAIGFFAASGASIFTIELLDRYVVPGMDDGEKRLAGRIALAATYFMMTLLACFLPVTTAVVSSLTLSLSAQLLPAFLGLCWLPWISRSAIIAGLIVGSLLVIFTEPPGLVLFDGLFVELPWGRWPLTIHSAAWGLAFNLAACLVVCLWTRNNPERRHRDALHDIYRRDHRIAFGGRAARGVKWSLPLLWAFLALGPGAILGNSFFSRPIFVNQDAALGVPSLWVWQIMFWIAGVLLVWWLAYRVRLSVIDASPLRPGALAGREWGAGTRLQPRWIALSLARLARREQIAGEVKAAP